MAGRPRREPCDGRLPNAAVMTRPVKVLEITSYPPPRAGWGMRVYFLKRQLESEGHSCVVLNTGRSRTIPSPEYETVLSGSDFLAKVWRFSRRGYTAHVHVNGASPKGFLLTIAAQVLNLLTGRRPVLTFHAGTDQTYFPRHKAPRLVPLFWLLFALPRAIICNSQSVKDKIVEYGVSPRKIFPIPAFSRQYLEFDRVALPGGLEAFYGRFPRVLFCYLNIRPVFFPVVLMDAFAQVAGRHPDVGLVMCGVLGHQEPGLWDQVQASIDANRLAARVMIVEDLDHDAFLTALARATMYVRTHVSDGVCSSVLEALALRVPVVAAENGTRPAGVVTYPPADATALAAAVERVLSLRDEIAVALPTPVIDDTLSTEIAVLADTHA